MLFPQSNRFRQVYPLPAFWEFCFDPSHLGLSQHWENGVPESRPVAVPASWNDQFADGRDNLGPAWYQIDFDQPAGMDQHHVFLRFGSVNYLAEVWLNGSRLGSHEGGHLPFEFQLTGILKPEGNRLVVRVDGTLAPDRVPPGAVPKDPVDSFQNLNNPDTSFDFFPYCGIHRPVLLYTLPSQAVCDLKVVTTIQGEDGFIDVTAAVDHSETAVVRFQVKRGDYLVSETGLLKNGTAAAQFRVPEAAFWSPASPVLYDLTVEVEENGVTLDRYTLPVGIRTIEVQGDRLLLNGSPIKLTGFGRHEDFPIAGRGFLPAVVIKDFELMKWTGANSFRTSHYPYAEELMLLADRLGFLVIDEIPAVGLFFNDEGLDRRLELCRQYTRELIERDKNHPSVIAWSLANEPMSLRPAARPFFQDLYHLAKELDTTRPVTLVSAIGVPEESFEFMDLVCLNRYYGWYSEPGQIDLAAEYLEEELTALHAAYQKPVILTEFGADTYPGHHAQPPEMFSEEFQVEFLKQYIEVCNRLPFVVGQHVWNLCDFKTSQAVHRMNSYNYKGVFTRDRRPKMAAHFLRKMWKGES